MSSAVLRVAWVSLSAALLWPLGAAAQGFSADYALGPSAVPAPSAPGSLVGFDMGSVRLAPAIVTGGRFSGAGLSLQAGQNWFAQVGLGRSIEPVASLGGVAPSGAFSFSAGYRWNDGESLSLAISRPRGERLGLSVSYDWPRYYVRMSYEPGLSLTPADMVRFSAGLKF